MNRKDQPALWKIRARLIMQVQAGKLSAKEAASQMGVSRKTYYQWEKKALAGMADSLSNGHPGRPMKLLDPKIKELQTENRELKKKLLIAQQTQEVRNILQAMKANDEKDLKKKNLKGRS